LVSLERPERAPTGGREEEDVSTSLIYFIHALSPLHMGTGAATGGIDLPHSREASTGLPNAPGSGIKGVLRDELKSNCNHHTRLFGAEHDNQTNRDQGALLFSDALLLCLPVPSYSGGFAWVSSPAAVRRYERERRACGLSALPGIPSVTDGRAACAASPLLAAGKLYLHDVALEHDNGNSAGAAQIAGDIAQALYGTDAQQDIKSFAERFVIVDDKVLGYLASVAMDHRTRIAIKDDTKTVRKGGLWTEENLPSETVLWGSIAADTLTDSNGNQLDGSAALKEFKNACGTRRRLQLGGKATVGRGIVQFVLG
jgi:CRISPR-associated protein Cmr4